MEPNPLWTGNAEDVNNAAILTIPISGSVSTPTLADPALNLFPNSIVHGFRMGDHLQVDPFVVVANIYCFQVDNLSEAMFCPFSNTTSMQTGKLAHIRFPCVIRPHMRL